MHPGGEHPPPDTGADRGWNHGFTAPADTWIARIACKYFARDAPELLIDSPEPIAR